MNADFPKLQELVRRSSLSPSDQEDMLAFFAAADVELAPLLIEALEAEPSLIEALNANYQAKRGALALGDAAAWQKIIDGEEEGLKRAE